MSKAKINAKYFLRSKDDLTFCYFARGLRHIFNTEVIRFLLSLGLEFPFFLICLLHVNGLEPFVSSLSTVLHVIVQCINKEMIMPNL